MNCPRCGKAVGEHEAGRCLDAWFAEVVMGWCEVSLNRPGYETHHSGLGRNNDGVMVYVPNYSTDIAAAWSGLERIGEQTGMSGGVWRDPEEPPERLYGADFLIPYDYGDGQASDLCVQDEAPTAALAIVRACIKVKLEERE